MSPEERAWRTFAQRYRNAEPTAAHPTRFLRRRAAECDHAADLLALADLDLSADVCGWSAVAALAGEAP